MPSTCAVRGDQKRGKGLRVLQRQDDGIIGNIFHYAQYLGGADSPVLAGMILIKALRMEIGTDGEGVHPESGSHCRNSLFVDPRSDDLSKGKIFFFKCI